MLARLTVIVFLSVILAQVVMSGSSLEDGGLKRIEPFSSATIGTVSTTQKLDEAQTEVEPTMSNSSACANSTTTDDGCHSNTSSRSHPDSGARGFIQERLGIDDDNFDMYVRAFYVVAGVAAIVLIYLGVKTFV